MENATKTWSNSSLGKCQVVSEECLQRVIFKTKSKIIGLTLTRTNVKQKLVVFP